MEQLVEGRNYIYGEFRICRRSIVDSFDNINPSTGESLGSFPQSTEHEVDEVVGYARDAFKEWKNVSRVKRAQYFSRIAQLLEMR